MRSPRSLLFFRDEMGLGWEGRVACASACHPVPPCLAKQLTQRGGFHLSSLREGQCPPLHPPPPPSACLGPSGPPRTSVPCRAPQKELTWRNHVLPIARTRCWRWAGSTQRLVPREGMHMWSRSIPPDHNLPPRISAMAQLHASGGMGRG